MSPLAAAAEGALGGGVEEESFRLYFIVIYLFNLLLKRKVCLHNPLHERRPKEQFYFKRISNTRGALGVPPGALVGATGVLVVLGLAGLTLALDDVLGVRSRSRRTCWSTRPSEHLIGVHGALGVKGLTLPEHLELVMAVLFERWCTWSDARRYICSVEHMA